MACRRLASFLAVACALGCPAGEALADAGAMEQARDAFDQGTAAYERADYAAAAAYFARADEILPNDAALEAAIRSALRADDPPLALRLTDRAARSSTPGGLADVAAEARRRFRERAGRIVVRCSLECTVRIGARTVPTGIPVWTLAGSQSVAAASGNLRASRVVDVVANGTTPVEIDFAAPPEPPTSPAARRKPLAPIWVWASAGVALGATAAAVGSGVAALGHRSDFVDAGCVTRGSAACDELASEGRSATLRTNLFGAAAATFAITSVVVALFLVDWRGKDKGTWP